LSFTLRALPQKITDASKAPVGSAFYYRCLDCRGILPSNSAHDANCGCGNIAIDIASHRLFVYDFRAFEILEAVGEL
jgi:hypothetical protein